MFVWLILSPFIEQEKLCKIFGTDMAEDETMQECFDKLVGIASEKPFECVGSVNEVNAAITLTIRSMKEAGKKLPYLRRDIGVVFQDFRLLPDRNVYENIAFAQKVVEAPNRKIKSRVLAMLSMVGLLDKYKAFPNELSGGEQQRIAIARALVNKPAILLCDEPTGNLDPANSNEIMKILNQVNKQGTTVLVVTHNMEIVQQMKKRTITMSEGKIISDQEKGGYFYED